MSEKIKFYTYCNPIVTGCTLYSNQSMTIPASDGFYSDGENCYIVNSSVDPKVPGMVISYSAACITPICFILEGSSIPLNGQYNTVYQSDTKFNERYYYEIPNLGFIYWLDSQNVWAFSQDLGDIDPNNDLFAILDNNSFFYPISDTNYIWSVTTKGINYGIILTQSNFGVCAPQPTPTPTPTSTTGPTPTPTPTSTTGPTPTPTPTSTTGPTPTPTSTAPPTPTPTATPTPTPVPPIGGEFYVSNNASTGAILEVFPTFYTVDIGSFPLFNFDVLSGTHAGTDNPISVNVSTSFQVNLSLFINGNPLATQCITINSSGTYAFTAITIAPTDIVSIVLEDGACV